MELSYRTTRLQYQFEYYLDHCLLAVAFFLPLSLEITSGFLGVAAVLWAAKMISRRRIDFGAAPFDKTIAFLVLVSSASIFAAPDRGFSFYNYYHLMGSYIFIYYLVVHNVHTSAQLKRMMGALLLSSLFVALYGLYQYFFGIDVSALEWVDGAQFPDLKTRVFSTLKNPNLLAGFLVTMMSIATGIGLYASSRLEKALLMGLVVLMGVCLVLTYSRGAWLSLLAIICAYGFLYSRKIFWLLLLVPIAMLVCHDAVMERLVSILNPTDTSSTLRLALWESTLAMIADHPFLGIGWGAFLQVYPAYDFFVQDAGTKIFHAHNMYLNIAAEIGLPGLFAFVGILFGHTRLALSAGKLRSGNWAAGFLLGTAVAMIGLAINGMTDYILFNIRLSMLFWLLNGMVVAASRGHILHK